MITITTRKMSILAQAVFGHDADWRDKYRITLVKFAEDRSVSESVDCPGTPNEKSMMRWVNEAVERVQKQFHPFVAAYFHQICADAEVDFSPDDFERTQDELARKLGVQGSGSSTMTRTYTQHIRSLSQPQLSAFAEHLASRQGYYELYRRHSNNQYVARDVLHFGTIENHSLSCRMFACVGSNRAPREYHGNAIFSGNKISCITTSLAQNSDTSRLSSCFLILEDPIESSEYSESDELAGMGLSTTDFGDFPSSFRVVVRRLPRDFSSQHIAEHVRPFDALPPTLNYIERCIDNANIHLAANVQEGTLIMSSFLVSNEKSNSTGVLDTGSSSSRKKK